MAISFRASGKLEDLLKQFRADFLPQLSQDDLRKTVLFSIQEAEEISIPADLDGFRARLIEVIQNE